MQHHKRGMQEISSKIREIFRRVFQEPELEWRRELSPADLPRWDSRHNEHILLEVEREFRVHFRANEALQMKTAGDLADAVHARLSGGRWP